ncbi:MAG: succinate dehydrogenase cytochrome b558 subunit, partial [Planctomycetales bacterium]|nr:succinate dehydrogenase cytochrome b558 subunit [Planctomycetales bacterium]
MVVHLMTNASVLDSPAAFQRNVNSIHTLGKLLPVVEWGFIFLPILFHAIIGVAIIRGAVPNTRNYPYAANWRYTLQRITGVIAFIFIFQHVFQMHGWFHNSWWMENVARPFGGAQFDPHHAASSAGKALQGWAMAGWYVVGILACVFHLANGIWTMGITWGVWISERAQRRALVVCTIFGIALAAVGLGALGGMRDYGQGEEYEQAREVEERLLQQSDFTSEHSTPSDANSSESAADR